MDIVPFGKTSKVGKIFSALFEEGPCDVSCQIGGNSVFINITLPKAKKMTPENLRSLEDAWKEWELPAPRASDKLDAVVQELKKTLETWDPNSQEANQ